MDLKQLRYFVAVAEELHFGRAAKRLFISQPALSFDIRKFEDELGVQLFARTSKSVALTNAGEVLLGEARRLLLQAQEAQRLTIRSASGLAGRLKVGFVNSMLYRGLPSAVRRFEADYPNVEVVLKEMNTHEQVQAILRGQIDVGYAHWGTFPPEISADTIFSEPFLCCLPAAHRLARRRRVDLAALAHEPFILFPRDAAPHYHDLIIAQCVSAGFSPQIRHEARLWQTVLTMVEFEMGVALVPSVLRQVRSERLRYLPLAGDALESRTLRLRRSDEREPVAERFGEYLDDGIRRLRGAAK
ncbi:LysR family transcriptional regulator [Burkholderia thailandensis]|uniref:Transcriptional regulator, LysR family n=1 Tax=Burkholderia thailandensis (strain ATCC 700388 / DSM 13276 / CCUG 48851 / CIP 106301 / E264) TaxID=271848 RepID=Q2SXI6_BURTA|nr:LysR family transcriptional regulator [Burkholderia thailandensis]ABC38632.1 transcriptional regulator, LysR family [Burkholderia thailandensis E264]AHI73510.1 bacterial regulatory helix-turn-helix, lysR family protein [Burkholderia thailandensis 2002721723]AHI79767.1 bacterial regulatory helix-turn-helix, lysR family protein [Burkholderia thailandensis E444]AIC87592.1 bacterial regulatory helix-turn-helix, lysR family protein [Burkholderia thailandensis USAMRU Malaysia \